MTKNKTYILVSLLGTVIVLWQLLVSGYVLTLDMVFGPHIDLVRNTGDLLNTAPTWYVLSFLTTIFGGWIAQKILLITIVFLLFYLPLHFYKRIFGIEKTEGDMQELGHIGGREGGEGGEYIASIFFAINPFVYERFLAGQWAVLLGYVLLVPLTAYLIAYCKEWNYKNTLKLLGIIILMGATSTHYFIISILVTAVVLAINFVYQKFSISFLKKSMLLALSVVIVSSYWLIPAVLSKNGPIETFGPKHWEVFKTATDVHLGTVGNVLTLHGFWGEHEHWAERFVLPKSFGPSFGISFALLLIIIISGIYFGIKDKRIRAGACTAVFLMIASVIFSCGIGDGVFRNLNIWMFEHISFWKGFRDLEKWSAVLALGYAFFAGFGAQMILDKIKSHQYRRIVLYVIIFIPLLSTPMMLFGFSNQLKTTEYPSSWAEVNKVLKTDKNCRALFLPWHQYYSLKFNNNILTGNVSRSYFDCDILNGKNMELGIISSQGGNGEEYDLIEKDVINNSEDPDSINSVIDILKKHEVKYVIFTDDLILEDIYRYPFLVSKHLERVVGNDGIYLFKII